MRNDRDKFFQHVVSFVCFCIVMCIIITVVIDHYRPHDMQDNPVRLHIESSSINMDGQ